MTTYNEKDKALVVDDEPANRTLLTEMLRRNGYDTVEAEDGRQAIALFQQQHFDIVLMDIMMPGMNGYEAAENIRALSSEAGEFCPILFLTALSDEKSLSRCVEFGGDDFLTKPYNLTLLKAKLAALSRTKELYDVIKTQRDEMAVLHARLEAEHELAERVFTKIHKTTTLDQPNIHFHVRPMGITSGDLLLAEMSTDGKPYLFLGDFTGHGLAAALGALPASDVFLSMAAKGLPVEVIAREMNRKLHSRLPTGIFCAAVIAGMDPDTGTITIWNGGIPDLIWIHGDSRDIELISPANFPLGVVDDGPFSTEMEVRSFTVGDQLLMVSDGVIEAENGAGEQFGMERLLALVKRLGKGDCTVTALRADLEAHLGDLPQKDDITLLEYRFQ